jgi:hypothetical protein
MFCGTIIYSHSFGRRKQIKNFASRCKNCKKNEIKELEHTGLAREKAAMFSLR